MELDGREPKAIELAELYRSAGVAKRSGRFEEAIAGFRKVADGALGLCDQNRVALAAGALQQLSYFADGALTEAEIRIAEDLAAATIDGGEAGWVVRFGLGQAYAERGDPAAAMRWLDDANAMRRAAITYSADAMERLFLLLARTFDGETIARLSALGAPSPKPVFVVGMPRSGTSLVEQILASVPGVHGAGELTAVAELARDVNAKDGGWPAGAAGLTAGRVRWLTTAYLVHLHKLAPKAERVVDKMPANAQNVGLILSLFPGATILHVRRDPLDNCFGCYRQTFGGEINFAYDQTELGRYYRYLDWIMDHWKAAAPGRIVEVNYTELVQNFEPEARRLVAAMNMPWSDACLEFHKTERQIDTASAKQARQPLFTSGLGAAEPYRPYLQDLEASLAA